MIYRVLADLTMTLHMAFIVFVVFGGLLVAFWRWIAWLHMPTALWGALISIVGWTCPLTPLENYFRRRGGEAGFTESFLEHYLISIIYPEGITRTGFMALGVGVVVVNLLIYWWAYRKIGEAEEAGHRGEIR